MGGDANRLHDVEDLFTQVDIALSGSVLECLRAALGDDSLDGVSHGVEVEGLNERHSAGK